VFLNKGVYITIGEKIKGKIRANKKAVAEIIMNKGLCKVCNKIPVFVALLNQEINILIYLSLFKNSRLN